MIPVIAIIGRPNVGKSTLFNRILGRRTAVVDDFSGVTRDRNYRASQWQGLSFSLVDTGGMVPNERESIARSVNEQVRMAVGEASAVLMVVEAGCGIQTEDMHIAKFLRKEAVGKVLLIVNKAESSSVRFDLDVWRKLGLGDPLPVSSLHGSGVADALDRAIALCREKPAPKQAFADEGERPLRVAVAGRPNAGKSSFVNKLLNEKRMIVDAVPGTTRDAIDSSLSHKNRPVILIDTAGMRKKSHVKEDIEYYFNLRTIRSIERCDVCVVMVDTDQTLGVQDLRIVTKAIEMRRGIVLVWNKWDLVPKDHKTFDALVKDVKRHYQELRFVPMVSISALTGQRVRAVLDVAFAVRERMTKRVPAAEFEDNVFGWIRVHPHPAIPNDPVRFLGARQIDAVNPCFRFFVTNPKGIAPAFNRYLLNKIYDTYDFEGCPITLEYRSVLRPKKYGGPRFMPKTKTTGKD
ncbi:MAG: ribosome biogenesis GTPase Der [Chitinispirillaceae bacterium]|jgi:GTP-binding protein|nr:ribosome biogenesis GTPase Der [Chitinispirillaceae bacterium]